AALALAAIGRPAVSFLAEVVQEGNNAVRPKALLVLGMIGPDAREALAALTRALGDKDANIKALACLALGQIGRKAAPAIPRLTLLLDEQEPNVKVAEKGAGPRTFYFI